MKICHLTSVHSHTDTRIFIKECRSLARAGYEVHLVASGAPDSFVDGVNVHGVKKGRSGRLKRMTKTANEVYKKALEIDADVYHFHDPELIPIGFKLKKRGKKVIYDVHEDVPRLILIKHWIPSILRRPISIFVEQYENNIAKNFDVVVTATPFINNRFKSLGCNAVNINNYPIIDELYTPRVDWSKKAHAVCYVGEISKARGINEMVEAIDKTNAVLLLGGTFSDPNDKENVQKKKGWSKVRELGFLNRKQVSEVFQQAMAGLVVLHPTINYIDALPVKMFEYMAAGLPVIASNFPLLKDIIEEHKCGICVDPLNISEIAQAIQWIIDNPDKSKEMGLRGRKAVKEKFNWESESKKLIAVYQGLT
jgi:glycosyltransferase involved in cell wall biosynthesis